MSSPELKLYNFQQYTVERLQEVRSCLIGDDMRPWV